MRKAIDANWLRPTGSFLTSIASVLQLRIGFAAFCPARRTMPTTSFVARLSSGP